MTEPKYIITKSQLDSFINTPSEMMTVIRSLKPVEPMTDSQIKEIHSQSVVSAGTMWARPVKFARAIEQRIVGELK